MKVEWTKKLGTLVVVLALAAGTALAQAPDIQEQAEGGAAAGRGQRQGGRMGQAMDREAMQAMRNIWAVTRLLGAENATVANTEMGVDIGITAEGAEAIAELQKKTTETITAYKEAIAERAAAGGDAPPQRGNNLMTMLMDGRAQVEARNVETGVVVSFTSEDPALATVIQEQVPQFQERAAAERQMRERMMRQQEVARLLANENVTIETVETEKGLQLTITSDDPELQAQVKELLPKYLEDVKAAGNQPRFERRVMGGAEGAREGRRDPGNRGNRGNRGDRGARDGAQAAPER